MGWHAKKNHIIYQYYTEFGICFSVWLVVSIIYIPLNKLLCYTPIRDKTNWNRQPMTKDPIQEPECTLGVGNLGKGCEVDYSWIRTFILDPLPLHIFSLVCLHDDDDSATILGGVMKLVESWKRWLRTCPHCFGMVLASDPLSTTLHWSDWRGTQNSM